MVWWLAVVDFVEFGWVWVLWLDSWCGFAVLIGGQCCVYGVSRAEGACCLVVRLLLCGVGCRFLHWVGCGLGFGFLILVLWFGLIVIVYLVACWRWVDVLSLGFVDVVLVGWAWVVALWVLVVCDLDLLVVGFWVVGLWLVQILLVLLEFSCWLWLFRFGFGCALRGIVRWRLCLLGLFYGVALAWLDLSLVALWSWLGGFWFVV